MKEKMQCGLLVKTLHNKLEKQANNTLRNKDLTLMQVLVLMELRDSKEKQLSMKELEKKFSVAQSTMAGVISRLEQKKFVDAYGDPNDKRVKVAHITSEGESCCTEAAGYMAEAEQELLNGFTDSEKKIFFELLERAAENIS